MGSVADISKGIRCSSQSQRGGPGESFSYAGSGDSGKSTRGGGLENASLMDRLREEASNEAWTEFFQFSSRLIFQAARQRGLSFSDSDDVVQETMLTLTRRVLKFNGRAGGGATVKSEGARDLIGSPHDHGSSAHPSSCPSAYEPELTPHPDPLPSTYH